MIVCAHDIVSDACNYHHRDRHHYQDLLNKPFLNLNVLLINVHVSPKSDEVG